MDVGIGKERIKSELREISALINLNSQDESPELIKQKAKLLDAINLAEYNLNLGLDTAFESFIGEAVTRALAVGMENVAERLAVFIK